MFGWGKGKKTKLNTIQSLSPVLLEGKRRPMSEKKERPAKKGTGRRKPHVIFSPPSSFPGERKSWTIGGRRRKNTANPPMPPGRRRGKKKKKSLRPHISANLVSSCTFIDCSIKGTKKSSAPRPRWKLREGGKGKRKRTCSGVLSFPARTSGRRGGEKKKKKKTSKVCGWRTNLRKRDSRSLNSPGHHQGGGGALKGV